MERNALARIDRVGNRLGLNMVLNTGRSFFLHAEPLIMLYRKPYVLVKYADSNPERSVRHHGGEVWASLNDGSAGFKQIRLFFVATSRRIRVNPDEQMCDVVAIDDYVFPEIELDSFKQAIETMVMQRVEYEMLKMDADTSPL